MGHISIMRFTRLVFAAALVLLAQLLLPSIAYAKWLRAETRHFIIYSAGSSKQLTGFATSLERFDAVLQRRFLVPASNNPTKLTIYFLASQDAVAKLYGDKSGMVAGFYSTRKEGTFAVANRSQSDGIWDLDGMTVLFHEYAHHFMFRNFTYAYPSWYVEGFAEYLSTATFGSDGSWTLGRPAFHRAYGLLAGRKLPIERLLFGGTEFKNDEEADLFYGRSWLLVHMLSMKPEYKDKLSAYFAAIQAGKPDREAATEAFGDLNTLDKALDIYLKRSMTYYSSKKPVEADLAVSVTELDPVAGDLVMFRLNRMKGNGTEKSLAELRALAAANPARADAWYELALTERDMASDKEKAERSAAELAAEAAVDRALASDPNHVRANVLKADILLKRLEADGETAPAKWSAARKFLITANKYAVDDPLVLSAWYDSYVYQHKTPTEVARAALARAFDLAPEVTDLRVQLAFDLADQGKFDEAIRLVQFLAHDPHTGKQGQAVLDQLESMRRDARPGGLEAPATKGT